MRAALYLLALVSSALAISLGLVLPDSNVWDSLTYTITVPEAPGAEVTSGPWFFWAGLQPNGGGVVQPVLQWGQAPPDGWVNPDPPFPKVWQMVLWAVPADGENNNVSDQSEGIFADIGATITSTVNYVNGVWFQSATVMSGGGAGDSTSSSVVSNQYFQATNTTDSNAGFFVLESELHGSDTADWDFDVTFTDINLTAENTDGVSALCSSMVSKTDGNGFATISGYSLSADGKTCHWDSIVLSPP